MFAGAAARSPPGSISSFFIEDDVGIFAIDTIELIGGELPRRQRRLVEAWLKPIRQNCWQRGAGCRRVANPVRLSHSGRRYSEVGHPVHKVKGFEIVGPYLLRVEFADGLSPTIDLRPILEGQLYGPLLHQRLQRGRDRSRDPHACLAEWRRLRSCDSARHLWRRRGDHQRGCGQQPRLCAGVHHQQSVCLGHIGFGYSGRCRSSRLATALRPDGTRSQT